MGLNLKQFLWGGLAGGKSKDPNKAARPYLEQSLKNQQPYVDAGKNALAATAPQYANMAQNTNEYFNDIAKNYKQSEGFGVKRDELLRQARNTAAAGGFAGGEQHQKGALGITDALMNEDFQQWLNNYLGIQNTGLKGQQDTASLGFNAATNASNINGQQANNAINSADWKNKQGSQYINMLLTALGAGGGAMAGGPAGAIKGAQIGNNIGSNWM